MKKKIFISLTLLILLIGGYLVYNLYLKPDDFLRQVYLVPKDAIYIVETDDPLKSWNKFTEGKPWQFLKHQKKMEEMGKLANKLDSMLNANSDLMKMLGKRSLMISAHVTRRSETDYLYIFDLQKVSKLDMMKGQLGSLFESLDYRVTSRNFQNEKIYELYDPLDKSTLYLSIIGNHLVCSYTGLLVEKSIKEKDDPVIGRNLDYLEVENKTGNSGLCKIYVNYRNMNNYLTLLSGVPDDNMAELCKAISFTGLEFKATDDQFTLKGYTNLNDSVDSYLPALLRSGKNNITSQKILSHRTAFFLCMGFDDAGKFMDNVESVLQQDAETYQTFEKTRKQIEGLLKIDIRKNFLSWMEGEVVFAQNTPGGLGRQNEFVVVIKMKDKDDAVKNLDYIENQIRKRTPVSFKTLDYEGYSVHYMQIKGFFKLLFGKMFEKLDKPYYTIIDDYAVFSNSPATLLSLIEDHRLGQTLDKDENFNRFMKEFNDESSIFAYTNTPKFFPLWKEFVSSATWKDLQTNEPFVMAFPQTAFQLTGNGSLFDTRWVAEFAEPQIDNSIDQDDDEEDPIDFSESGDTIQNLERFYLEKLQGNIYKEWYDNGQLRSESEMKNGIKNGKHKSYYPDGSLQAYGKFKDNKKNGTWRYYDENGKEIRKEKWKKGMIKD